MKKPETFMEEAKRFVCCDYKLVKTKKQKNSEKR
jgi:hypothetical protein